MTFLQIIVIAVVQGVTEFLPISSSGHLVIVPYVTGWTDQGLLVDVAVHVGTLGAVVIYLWRDVHAIAAALIRPGDPKSRPALALFGYVLLSCIPVFVVGAILHEYAGNALRSITVIAWSTIFFGILLYVADRIGITVRRMEQLTARDALVIGIFQALALIPGTSRSGITMTAARLLGYQRTEAARFSMLISIPTIVGAGALAALDLIGQGNVELQLDAVLAGLFALVAALITIALMMSWLKRATFTPFVAYRLVIGAALLWWVYA